MLRILFISAVLVIDFLAIAGGEKSDRQRYIEQWKDVAMEQMRLHGIPASITLAQGILESGDGKSDLSVRANNHFGIKCHEWKGPGVYQDDDKKNECFRKYRNASESYEDHSAFLKRTRYAFLFEYEVTDYRSWARGLKKAGYATDPRYADRLIKIIEENDLASFDRSIDGDVIAMKQGAEPRFDTRGRSNTNDNLIIDLSIEREVKEHPNGIDFILARDGDNVESIARSLDLAPWQISRYNDITASYVFKGGEMVYLQPKKNKAKAEYHLSLEGETLRLISQRYGVKIKKLEAYNGISADEPLTKGQKVFLQPT